MNNHVAGLLVSAFACNARIAGMQAANQERESRGEAPAYGEDAFGYEANELQNLSQAIHAAAHYP